MRFLTIEAATSVQVCGALQLRHGYQGGGFPRTRRRASRVRQRRRPRVHLQCGALCAIRLKVLEMHSISLGGGGDGLHLQQWQAIDAGRMLICSHVHMFHVGHTIPPAPVLGYWAP